MKEITFKLYNFEELSDSAKEDAVRFHKFYFVDLADFDDVYKVIEEIDCGYDRKMNSQVSFTELFPNYDSPLRVDCRGRKLMHYVYFTFIAGRDYIDNIYRCVYDDLREMVESVGGNAVDYHQLVRLFEKYIERAFDNEEEYCCSDEFVEERLLYSNFLFFEDGQKFEAKKGVKVIA